MKNYYEILGIAPSATEDDIKAAYRKLAARYHPDRNTGQSDADHKFKEAKEAYETLSDPVKRREYIESRNQQILTNPLATAGEMWRTFIHLLTGKEEMSKKIKPSARFVDLLSLYLSEVEDLGADSSGNSKKILDRHIAERRANFESVKPLLGSNPEMGAVMFYGMKVDTTMARRIVTAEVDDLPSWDVVELAVTVPKGTEGLLTQIEDKTFLVIAAGLEWARQNQKLIIN